jgi:hypothetical protein
MASVLTFGLWWRIGKFVRIDDPQAPLTVDGWGGTISICVVREIE